jgi:hypothetical protein
MNWFTFILIGIIIGLIIGVFIGANIAPDKNTFRISKQKVKGNGQADFDNDLIVKEKKRRFRPLSFLKRKHKKEEK